MVFDVTFNTEFESLAGANTNNGYLNIVLYNATNNTAYYERVYAGSSADPIVFKQMSAGDYYIGIYESGFYDIIGDSDLMYSDDKGNSYSIYGENDYYYGVKFGETGIEINVKVTKSYEHWLYDIDAI